METVGYGTRSAHEVKTEDGHVLTVAVSGAESGWPIFLMHGTPGSRTGPKPRTSVLYQRGIRLICYDRPGYGGSTRREGRRVLDAAWDVKAIADDLGISRFSVVGRSGGGPHALACAAALPDRVHRAATLVSVAPNDPELDWLDGMTSDNVDEYKAAAEGADRLADRLTMKARLARREPESLLAHLTTQMTDADKIVTGKVALQWQLADCYAEALRTGPFGWIDDVLAIRSSWDFDLKSINVPVRLWHGLEDNFSPVAHTRWLARHIPGAEVQIQRETAHFGAVGALPDMLMWLAADADARPAAEQGVDSQSHAARNLHMVSRPRTRPISNRPRLMPR